MNAALFILAVTCIFMGGLLLYVAIRCNKLIDENRSFKATIRTLSAENDKLKDENERLTEEEPTAIEAVASLVHKCKKFTTCDNCLENASKLYTFCRSCLYKSPSSWLYNMKGSPGKDAQELGYAVETKVKEYKESD